MKKYNCPDCMVQENSCNGCQRAKAVEISNTIPEYPDTYLGKSWSYIPECCKNCSNHPSNGGSGICHCTLPYMDSTNPFTPTWTTSTNLKILTTDDEYGNIIITTKI